MNTPNIPENPPAFPQEGQVFNAAGGVEKQYIIAKGMSLRDWFAGKALTGLIGTPQLFTVDAETSKPIETWSEYAQAAYKMADAMLATRQEAK